MENSPAYIISPIITPVISDRNPRAHYLFKLGRVWPGNGAGIPNRNN